MIDPTGFLLTSIRDDPAVAAITTRIRADEPAPGDADWIIDATCQDRSFGARPLRRAIQRYVEDPLSEEIIRGAVRGGFIEVGLEGGRLSFSAVGDTRAGQPLA